MINFEKGIPLKSIHIRRDFRPIHVCSLWVDDKLEWGFGQCEMFDFGSRIVVRRPGYPDEFIFPHALRSARLKDPLDIHCVLKPDKVGSSGKTAANAALKKTSKATKQAAAFNRRLIQHDTKKAKN